MSRPGTAEPHENRASLPGALRPPPKVLVAEDNADLRTCIREVFEMTGFSVDTSANGLDAVELASRRRYDVVVSDIHLPGLSGLAVGRSLRAMVRPPRLVFITAYPDWKVLQEAKEAGADHVLNKPLDLRKLASLVSNMASGDSRTTA